MRRHNVGVSLSTDIAALYRRDLTRLLQELEAFPDDGSLWKTMPGVTNSAGNLALHLEGNLREFLGRQMGGVPYSRARDLEFSAKDLPKAELMSRVENLRKLIPVLINELSAERLEAMHPQTNLGNATSNLQLLIHLNGHLNYHLGQIDILRRVLTGNGAIEMAKL
jgi:hypothetical protein